MDTAAKRSSALNAFSPVVQVLPSPDGTIDQGDRQTVGFSYAGILAAELIFAARPFAIVVDIVFANIVIGFKQAQNIIMRINDD